MRYSLDSLTDGPLIKAAQPIPNKEIIDFWDSLDLNLEAAFNYDIIPQFKKNYAFWIKESKKNNLHGLERYSHLSLSHGTSEAFHIFWAKHSKRRLRCFKAEFVLHKLIWRNNQYDYKFLEDDRIRKNDAVIISLPYSYHGGEHPRTKEILEACNKLDVPVIIDCAYMVIAKDMNFNFDQDCIETVTFSLSKGFWGIDKLRCGIRFQKNNDDDGIDVSNIWGTLNLVSLTIADKLISTFSPDYNWETFEEKYNAVIQKYDLRATNCILFALGDDRYKDFNRGGDVNRVCISNALNNINTKDLNE